MMLGEDSFNALSTIAGSYGTFSITSTGAWSYSLNSAAVQFLGLTETIDDIFTVTSLDGTSEDITITITGLNDLPTATNGYITGPQSVAYTFAPSDFGFTDLDSSDSLNNIMVSGLNLANSVNIVDFEGLGALPSGAALSSQGIATTTLTSGYYLDGIANGDSGNWDMEGSNGSYMVGFNSGSTGSTGSTGSWSF